MADRLFRTISSGRPYQSVKTNEGSTKRIKRQVLVHTRTPKRHGHQTGDPNDNKPLRQLSHSSSDDKINQKSVEMFDMEAQQSRKSASSATANLLRLQSKISVQANSVNNSNKPEKPRMSLLGRPVNLTHRPRSSRDSKRRKYQFLINNFLERPSGRISLIYHLFV